MAEPVLIRVNPFDPRKALLVPYVSQRVMEHAAKSTPEVPAQAYLANVMQRLYGGDESLLLAAVWDKDNNAVVGHLLAAAQDRVAAVLQYHTDPGNWGDVLGSMVRIVDEWAESRGATHVQWQTSQKDGGPLRKRGFRVSRYTLEREKDSE